MRSFAKGKQEGRRRAAASSISGDDEINDRLERGVVLVSHSLGRRSRGCD